MAHLSSLSASASPWRFLGRLMVLYVLDWVFIIGTIAFAGSMSFWAKPTARPFSLTNSTISYPFTKSTKIPTWLLVILAIFIPALIIFLSTVLNRRRDWKRKLYSLNTAWLGLGLAIASAMLITDAVKNLAGKPRPDMLSRCMPNESLIAGARVGYEGGGLVTRAVCEGNPMLEGGVKRFEGRDLEDGFRSFPSGHASMSFAGLSYLTIFLAEFLFSLPLPHISTTPLSAPIARNPTVVADREQSSSRRRRRRHDRRRSSSPATRTTTVDSSASQSGDLLPRFPIMCAILLCSIPLLLALYVSCTRYTDFRHHPADLIAGSLLGVCTGVLGWRWYGSWCCVADVERRIYMLGGGRRIPGAIEGMSVGADGRADANGKSGDEEMGDFRRGGDRRRRRRRDDDYDMTEQDEGAGVNATLSGDTFAERYPRGSRGGEERNY